MSLDVTVVSPARPVFEGSANKLVIQAMRGQMGVLPKHADIVAALGVGPLRITQADGSQLEFAVWGGFLKIGGSRVTVLVDQAVAKDEIVESEAQKDLTEVKAQLRHPKSDEEFQELLGKRKWAEVRLGLVGARATVSH